MMHHPKSLPYLFLTEFWERFGFYAAQGLMILYITEQFGFSDSISYKIMGIFTALLYIAPLFGGYFANNILGFKTAIISGGLLLILGYGLLALPNIQLFFYSGLSVIVVGNGLFKPNISSLLALQYTPDDPRRDSGFTLFYVGINLGAFLAGASAGYVKNAFGFQASFALSSIGLIIGLVTFVFGLKKIKDLNIVRVVNRKTNLQIVLCVLVAIQTIHLLLRSYVLSDWLLPCAGTILLCFLLILTQRQKSAARKKMWVLNILIVSSIVFWTLFFQLFYSANLFVDRLVDKNFLGIHLTTTLFWSSESIFLILLGPFFVKLWNWLARINKNFSPLSKFILGLFFVGIAFLVLAESAVFLNEKMLISPTWIFLAYFFIAIGELFLSPIGLAAVALFAPTDYLGFMMGTWFAATGFGGMFAGMIAQFANIPVTVTSPFQKAAIYRQAFLEYAGLAFLTAFILILVYFALRKVLR